MPTKIDWCDEVWNPVTGCSKISVGCEHCYAERMAKRLAGRCGYSKKYPFQVTLHKDRMDLPLHWRKPRRIFVNSMGDLFHADVSFRWIDDLINIIAVCKQHTFLILTKRPGAMKKYFEHLGLNGTIPNIWLGVTAENQQIADDRIPLLLQIPAAKRFVSVEPMLELMDFTFALSKLDWVICGGETGPGARPIQAEWVRGLRDQCVASGVPFFFKGWGEWVPSNSNAIGDRASKKINRGVQRFDWVGNRQRDITKEHWSLISAQSFLVGKKAAGQMLDGREWKEMPK